MNRDSDRHRFSDLPRWYAPVFGCLVIATLGTSFIEANSAILVAPIVTVLLVLAAGGQLAKGARKTCLLILAFSAIAFAVFLGELAGMLLHREFVRDDWSAQLQHLDKTIGLVDRSNIKVRHQRRPLLADYALEWDVEYSTEADGSRLVPQRPDSGRNISLFGGSFLFGEGLNDDETISAKLQERLSEYRVWNFGIRGHGTGQNSILMQRVSKTNPEGHIGVLCFIPAHVMRTVVPVSFLATDWGRHHIRVVVREGQIQNLGPAQDSLTIFESIRLGLRRRSSLYRRFGPGWEASESDWAAVRDIMIAARDSWERRSPESRFLLVILASTKATADIPSAWLEELENAGIRVLDTNPRFAQLDTPETTLFYSDGHPRPVYARHAAAFIADAIRELDK